MVAALLGSSLLITSCGTVLDQHGYVAQIGAVEDLTIGMKKSEVTDILGSPSVITKANGLSYYYMSSLQSRYNLLGAKENDRKVVAVHFSNAKRIKKIAHYGLKDGYVIDFISNTTPSYKKDLNIIQEIFSNVGRFTPSAGGSGFAQGNGIKY